MQECARYLETLKAFQAKGAAGIQGRTEEDYLSRLHGALGAVPLASPVPMHSLLAVGSVQLLASCR